MIDVKKMCRDKGLRMTEQRNIIADVITEMSANGHPDVNEIFLNANEQDKNISIATVYRTVKLFEEYGAIEKHEFKDGRSRYEAIEDHHHDHLIDIESGEIHEFTNEEIEEIQKIFLIELYLAHCFFFLFFIKITSVILHKTSLFYQYKSCKIIFLKITGFCENKKTFFRKL